ncbi:hypothetical protein B0H19DRAFT_1121075 [Mycena capillaripes]|nr:hypothetical protein B0H19DRAFT_1121075 [Mycena capillaripes]
MPPERSRYPRDGAGLVWTLPVEPVGECGIGFSPEPLTECTFTDLLPCEPFMFADECPPTRASRSPRRRKKSGNHIPRPPNAFILFRSWFIKSQRVSTEVETNHSTLSKIIGMTWKKLGADDKKIWHTRASDAVEEHKRNFPTYTFRPQHTPGKKADSDGPTPKTKRKVREVYQDPVRCEKIAELLVEGMQGDELDRAIQEFDKHHVPEIVTRFEVPITDRAYRCSLSGPARESKDSRKLLSSPSACSASNSRRRRSSSLGDEIPTSQDQVELQRMPSPASIFIDAGSTSTSDGQLTPPSLDSFSSLCKQESNLDTFDFSAFSSVASPAPSFSCDPLMMPMSPSSPLESCTFDHQPEPSSPDACTPAESMDISSFLPNEWLQAGDSASPFAGDSASPFDGCPSVDYSPAFGYPVPSSLATDPTFCSNLRPLGFENQPYHVQDPIPALEQLEADLASLIAQYSL